MASPFFLYKKRVSCTEAGYSFFAICFYEIVLTSRIVYSAVFSALSAVTALPVVTTSSEVSVLSIVTALPVVSAPSVLSSLFPSLTELSSQNGSSKRERLTLLEALG